MPTIKGNGPRPATGIRRALKPLKPLYLALPLSLRRHLLFYRAFRTWGNFRRPTSSYEKFQWRIINDHRTWLGVTSDKLAQKEYARRISTRTGLPIKIPETYWVGTDARELQKIANQLPARWVFKPNHSCGRFRLYDSGSEAVDWSDLISVGDSWMKSDEEEIALGHFGYSLARKLLFAEQRIGDSEAAPPTCSSYGTGGEAIDYMVRMGAHRPISERRTFAYLGDFKRVPTGNSWGAVADGSTSLIDTMGIDQRAELREIVAALTADFDFVRVDYYLDNGFWFGEYAPYSGSGLMAFSELRDRYWTSKWPLPDLSVPDPNETLWAELLTRVEHGTLQANLATHVDYQG